MAARALDVIRRKLVQLVRTDPNFRPAPTALERWLVARFSADEVKELFRIELVYGEAAMAEWFAEVLLEAGVVRVPVRIRRDAA